MGGGFNGSDSGALEAFIFEFSALGLEALR